QAVLKLELHTEPRAEFTCRRAVGPLNPGAFKPFRKSTLCGTTQFRAGAFIEASRNTRPCQSPARAPCVGQVPGRCGICQVKWDTSVQFIWGWASGWLIQAWVGMAG